MTIAQLINAVTAAECKSINKASNILYVSQPHLSSSIRALEKELGYTIFIRQANGVHLTEKGALFLKYARNILNQYDSMKLLSGQESVRVLHVAASNVYIFQQAFLKTLRNYQEASILDFQLRHATPLSIIEQIYQGNVMLGSTLLTEKAVKIMLSKMKSYRIQYTKLAEISSVITLRLGHPLAEGGILSYERLKNYPFVDYLGNPVVELAPGISNYVDPSKMIQVGESSMRHMVVSSSDAFSIGCVLPQEYLDSYHLQAFPLPDFNCQIGLLQSSDNELSAEYNSYITYLQEYIQTLHADT